uniref:Uncharacterized protein n=1 Tax=Arundo donax TaxID=35708 RepID=A0A0A9ADC8_ARUDO
MYAWKIILWHRCHVAPGLDSSHVASYISWVG